MANVIQIKRSATAAAPTTLSNGELAYSHNSDKLFIGAADGTVIQIGGNDIVTKLAGIEAGATGDQTGTEMLNLIAALNTHHIMTSAEWAEIQAAIAGETGESIKLKLFALADTNNLTDVLLAKLNGIEANATVDQTATEIKALFDAEDDMNLVTDTEKTAIGNLVDGTLTIDGGTY